MTEEERYQAWLAKFVVSSDKMREIAKTFAPTCEAHFVLHAEAEDGWYDRARKVIEPIGDIDVVRVVKSISKAYDTPVQEGLQRCQELALEIAADFGQDISDVSNTN